MSTLHLFHLPSEVPTPELRLRTAHRLTGLVPVLTPGQIAAVAARLAENRRALLAMSTAELLAALVEAAARPIDPTAVSLATGLTPQQIAAEHAHLRELFSSASRLEAWLAHERVSVAELGREARGPAVILHVLGGLSAYPVWVSLSAGLLARSGNLVKPTSADLVTPVLWAQQLAAVDRRLGDALAVLPWVGGNAELEAAALSSVGLVTAYGSDPALADLRGRTPIAVPFLAHPHRFSLAVLSAGADWSDALPALVRDVWLVDLSGCLSPTLAVVEIGDAEPAERADALAAALARAFAESPLSFPTDRPTSVAQAIRRSREAAEFAELAGQPVRFLGSDDGGWSAVIQWPTERGRWPMGMLEGVLNVLLLPELAEIATLLPPPLLARIASAGLAGPASERGKIVRFLAGVGVPRLCLLGTMQTPPLEWNHDGRFHLNTLLSWSRAELQL